MTLHAWVFEQDAPISQKPIRQIYLYVKDVDTHLRDPRLSEFLAKHGAVLTGVTATWFKTLDELHEAVKNSIAVWIEDRLTRRGALQAQFIKDSDDLTEAPRKLIGRDDLLARLRALLENGERVLLQAGAGVGKTAWRRRPLGAGLRRARARR